MRPPITKVKGISDVRRLPRLGKIRLGVKKTSSSGKSYPAETSYFVVPPEVEAIYGPQPTVLDVRFPVDDMDIIFPQAYERWGSNHIIQCQGDGEVAWERGEGDSWIERACPCELLDKKKCSFRARLMVMLWKVSLAGVYQIDTGSKTSAFAIQSGIDYIINLIGRAAMIPCLLIREETIISYEGKAMKHYTMKLHLAQDEIKAVETFRNDPLRITYSVAEPEVTDPTHDPEGPVIPAGVTDEEKEALATEAEAPATGPEASVSAPDEPNGAEGGLTITDTQALELEALIDDNKLSMRAVLGSLVVADLADIPADQFEAAKDKIKGIIAARNGKDDLGF